MENKDHLPGITFMPASGRSTFGLLVFDENYKPDKRMLENDQVMQAIQIALFIHAEKNKTQKE